MMGTNDILTLITALLIAWSCSLLGCFLVLRKVVMVGDAISHSVLPGIVIAYLVTTNYNSFFILIGAALFGVFTTFIIDFFHRKLKLQEDASIGVTFTWLFALGVILIAVFTDGNADIDQDCVLFGELGTAFLDKVIFNGRLYGTRSIWMILPVFVLVLLFITKGFKGLQLTSFHQEYAKARGVSVHFWHYAFMSLVSITTVMSFESVGAILVVGLLVIPPASAYLLTSKLQYLLLLSCGFSTLACVLGYFFSYRLDVSLSSMIIVTAGALFLLSLLVRKIIVRMSWQHKQSKR
jgi:manganese/zinc/iron transport system permease protein